MTWISRAMCVLAFLGCGYVVISTPSEIDQLAVASALGRTAALWMLAVVSVASAIALLASFAPRRCSRVVFGALFTASAVLAAYGFLAWKIKGGIALPTAALAGIAALRFVELGAELLIMRRQTKP